MFFKKFHNSKIIEYPEHLPKQVVNQQVLPYNLHNKKIMFTNSMPKSKLEVLAVDILQAEVQDHLSDELDFIVIDNQDLNDNADYLEYAREHNIEFISEYDFWTDCILELEVYQSKSASYNFARELKHWQLENDNQTTSSS
jgi:hypothetical protein